MTEIKIKEIKRRITQYENELIELDRDLKVVKNLSVKADIHSRISSLERRLEKKEFELWKITKE